MKYFTAAFLVSMGMNAYALTAKDPLPTKLLSCGGATITQITGRLEGDKNFDTGAHVVLNNGGVTVTYQDDPTLLAIRESKVGDHVLICLVYVPGNCPKGDDRGKVYTVTDLHTLRSWTLPESQHSCGGA